MKSQVSPPWWIIFAETLKVQILNEDDRVIDQELKGAAMMVDPH